MHRLATIKTKLQNRKITTGIIVVLTLGLLFLSIPVPRFQNPYSTVAESSDGRLIGAHIASDEQWRFPISNELPSKYKTALLCFEDEYFFYHPGINPLSLVRASLQNIRQGHIVSGGSTISMQVARMSGNAPRTLANKLWEMLRALRLELSTSKKEILLMYAANAPFGGNIVGFETASWHYFERPPHHLTWAEAALLAVLPNAPAILRPGKNAVMLKKKRDFLLEKLYEKGHINHTELELSLQEPLPAGTRELPSDAPHLVDFFLKTRPGESIRTTIDKELQQQTSRLLQRHSERMAENQIHHAGLVIAEIETGNVVAYVGNSRPTENKAGHSVDMIRAKRSSGSILKPFLYASALQGGTILPDMLLADVPTHYRNYAPRNFHRRYDGAVPADEALSRSLNIPFVRLLHDYGGERFLKKLKQAGITTMSKGYEHYGLSLILGGGEVTLWDLVGSYASLGRVLIHYQSDNSRYQTTDFRPLNVVSFNIPEGTLTGYPPVFSAGAAWCSLEALAGVVRPPEETGWENFSSRQNIAWKTGTSFGFRDAWSVGINGHYVVGVWVGNASGEGRAGLLGGTTAGPLMFRIFDLLPRGEWFELPHDDMAEVMICQKSGHRAGPNCPGIEARLVPRSVKGNPACPYHERVHLTADRRYRTRRSCEPDGNVVSESWFVLPPLMAWYYSRRDAEYTFLPPKKPGCFVDAEVPMDFIYPNPNTTLMTPVDLDGEKQKIVFKVVHANPDVSIYWHLDNYYIGQTTGLHEMDLSPPRGSHKITVVDEEGNRMVRHFRVIE